MHSRCFAEQFFLENLDIFLRAPLYFCSLFRSRRLLIFLGAFDDEEFFVVDGSGGGGVAGQVSCHQLVSLHR